jgi:two-component system phosphate regulon sensor histidine kinase PhoR
VTTLAVAVMVMAVTAFATAALVNRRTRHLADATRDVLRDHDRRIPLASAAGAERELGRWINALAEVAEDNHEALTHERTLLASVADGLTQGVIAIDGDRKIEMVNEAARRMLGVQRPLTGEPLLDFVRLPALRELLDREATSTAELQLPEGPRVLVRVARTHGRPGSVLLLEDVTTVRRLETVRRDFVANVSHELRTPVAVIRANAETLLAGAKDDPAVAARLIEGLHRNAERLARILADLLDLSRLDAGHYRLDIANVAVKSIAEQSLSAIETNAQQRGVKISVVVPDDLIVRADPKALDQILVNLIDNAVKYTRSEGNVWIEAKHAVDPADAVRIEVRDDGPGIADKHRERVFERFYRADPGRSREAGGTGLGLSIVKHLAESMNGAVGVEPNSPSGSIFWLQLPRPTTKTAAA